MDKTTVTLIALLAVLLLFGQGLFSNITGYQVNPCAGVKCSGAYWDEAQGRCICPGKSAMACTDSDGGLNYYTKGTATGYENNQLVTSTDGCRFDGKTLVEVYCEGYELKVEQYVCPNGCQDGACIGEPTELMSKETHAVLPKEPTELMSEETHAVLPKEPTDELMSKETHEILPKEPTDELMSEETHEMLLKWTPSTDTVCSGELFTQTSNIGSTRTATGTKICPEGYYCKDGVCIKKGFIERIIDMISKLI